MNKAVLLLGLLLSFSFVQAQKYGHLNLGNLISLMPETAEADSLLALYQQTLVREGTVKAQAFQKRVEAFQLEYNDLSPKIAAERQAALEKEQQELVALEQSLAGKMQDRRAEMLNPIIERAQTAINEVAKENGYIMVFDTSIFNAILYAEETDDLLPLVLTKLNLKVE